MRFLAFVAGARGCGRRRRIGLELLGRCLESERVLVALRPTRNHLPREPGERIDPTGKARELPRQVLGGLRRAEA